MRKLKIAIIGYGGMGGYHASRLAETDKFEVCAIYDTDKSRYGVAKQNGIASCDAYRTKEDIASDPNVNAVLIATPNDVHGEYLKYFAAAGKHVICEKPVAPTSAEFAEMTDCAKRNGIVFAVHQNRRWDADFLTIKELYDKGVVGDGSGIGKILRIESRVQGGNGVPGDWRKFKEKGGGMMLDWGVHLIDQAVVMFGGAPDSIYCSYSFAQGFDVDDGFKLILDYPQTVMEIVVDTDCYIKTPRWIAYGENGTAVIEDWDLNGKVVKPIFSTERKIAGIKAGNGFTKTMAYRTADSLTVEDLHRVYPEEYVFYNEFYNAVVNGLPMTITHDQVMTVLKIMEAAARSAKSHGSVNLKELKIDEK